MTPRCPGHLGVAKPRCLGHRGVENLQCPRDQGVKNPRFPGVVSWVFAVFFNFNPLLQPLKQQSIKQWESTIFYTKTLCSCFKNFPNFIFSDQIPVSRTPGIHFKTWTTPQKFCKIPNGFKKCLIGAVWWKKPSKRSHATVPLWNICQFLYKYLLKGPWEIYTHIKYWLSKSLPQFQSSV